MTDVKYKPVSNVKIGYSLAESETITAVMRLSDKIVAVDGQLVTPYAAINDKTPPDVVHSHRYVLVELVMDGFNYEAFFEQQVQVGEAASRAIRQGADNDFIEYLVATLPKAGGGSDTRTYESGRIMLSSFHMRVTNRGGTKYQPATVRFKVRGNVT